MASETAKAAHRGNGGDLRNSQSGRADGSEHSQIHFWPQERLIGIVTKNSRSRFEFSLRTFEGNVRRVVIGIRDANGTGGYKNSGPNLVFAPDKIDDFQ